MKYTSTVLSFWEVQTKYFFSTAFLTPNLCDEEDDICRSHDSDDYVKNYSLNLLEYFFIFLDLKDAVKEGSGARLATLQTHWYTACVQHLVFLQIYAFSCFTVFPKASQTYCLTKFSWNRSWLFPHFFKRTQNSNCIRHC